MTVYLTSFKRYHADAAFKDGKGLGSLPGYSIAVYQPRWYPQLPVVDVFSILDADGRWVRPRDFIKCLDPENCVCVMCGSGLTALCFCGAHVGKQKPNPELLERYHYRLLDMYTKRWERDLELGLSLERDHFDQHEDVVLCCWCPYDRAAKRQLEDCGSFVCHSWPVESFLKELGIEVVRDADRERMVTL